MSEDTARELIIALNKLPTLHDIQGVNNQVDKIHKIQEDVDRLLSYFNGPTFFRKAGLIIQEFENLELALRNLPWRSVEVKLGDIEKKMDNIQLKDPDLINALNHIKSSINNLSTNNLSLSTFKEALEEQVKRINNENIKIFFRRFF